jgi:hypothetical protein
MMKTSRVMLHRIYLVAIVLPLLFASSKAQEGPPLRHLPIPEARVNGPSDGAQGNLWMSWSIDYRLGYVQGLLEGNYWGYLSGCTEARSAPATPSLGDKCLMQAPAVHLRSEEYAALVTEFYSKYPEDRELPMRHLLLMLLKPGMNVDGVHHWLDQIIESAHRAEGKK